MKITSIPKNKQVLPSFSIPHKNINFLLYNINPSSHNNDNFVMPVYHKLNTANHHYNNHTTDIIPLLPVLKINTYYKT